MNPYDDRALRELELLAVTRLVALESRAAPAAEPSGALAPRAEPVERIIALDARGGAPAHGSSAEASSPPQDLAALDWQPLREAAQACRQCRLGETRRQAVFGVGPPNAPWMFVGEGPGADEDAHGEPFVGQAGKLLDAMLASLQLSRERDVYITNVVKCRPPGNRVPQADEAAACAGYLDRQIDLLRPKLMVALGKTAALRLTGEEGSLAGQRGRRFTYRGVPLVVTYHPAYLLRNLPDKAKAWEDLLFARRVFNELAAGVEANPSP